MKIRTRLALMVGVVLILGGALIGGVTAVVVRQEAVASLDATLRDAIDAVHSDATGNVSLVLSFADATSVPLTAALFFDDGAPVVLVEGQDGETVLTLPELSVATVTEAVSKAVTVDGDASMRIRALSSGDGEWLVVGTTLRSVNSQFVAVFVRGLLVSVLIALIMVVAVWWLIRRELRPVTHITHDATRIAAGNLEVELSKSHSANEIGELTAALRVMVASLREAVAVTAHSEYRMRQFLGDASHELRTPLTVIRGYVDILNSEQELSPVQRERAMRRLVGESARMSRIINDLLLLAELGEVRHELTDDIDLSVIVNDHARDMAVQQPDRPITLTVVEGLLVRGNREHLERLVSNIVSNIVRHTDAKAEVAMALTKDGEDVVLVVDDAGPGLTPAMYQRTAEEFQRFDRSHSPNGGGFGLGLSIIASIVRSHDGHLRMSPSPLGGLRTRVDIACLK